MITILNKFGAASEKVKNLTNLVSNKNEPDFPLPEILKNLQKNEKDGGQPAKKQPSNLDKLGTSKLASEQENKASGWSNWEHNWEIDDEVNEEESPPQSKQTGKDSDEKPSKSLNKFEIGVGEDKAQDSKNESSQPHGWGIDEIGDEQPQTSKAKSLEKVVEDTKASEYAQTWQKRHEKVQKRLDDPIKFTNPETNALHYIVQMQEMRDIMKHEYELFHNERVERQKELERREAELQRKEAEFALKEKDLDLIEKRIHLKQKLQIDNQSLDKTIRANIELEQEARKAKEQLRVLQEGQAQLASKIKQQHQVEADQIKEQHKAQLKSLEQQQTAKISSIESEAERKMKDLKAKHQADLTSQLNKKESELKVLKTELASTQRERDDKEAQLLKLKQTHESEKQSLKKQKETDLEALHKQITAAHSTTAVLRQQLADLRNSHQAELKKITNMHTDEIKKLKGDLKDERENYKDLERETLLVSKTKKEEIIELSKEKEREVEELKSQLQKVNFKLETVQRDKDYLEKMVQEKSSSLETRKGHEQNEITKLLAQNSELREENQTLQVLITTFKAKLGDLQHNFKERVSVSSSRTGKSAELLPEDLHHSPGREEKSISKTDSLQKAHQHAQNEEPEVRKSSQKELHASKKGWEAAGADWNIEENIDLKEKKALEPEEDKRDDAAGGWGSEETPYEPNEVQAVGDQNPWGDADSNIPEPDQAEQLDEKFRLDELKSNNKEESLKVNLSESSINKRNQVEKPKNPFKDEEIEEEGQEIELIQNENADGNNIEEEPKVLGQLHAEYQEVKVEEDLQEQEESPGTPDFIEDSQANQIEGNYFLDSKHENQEPGKETAEKKNEEGEEGISQQDQAEPVEEELVKKEEVEMEEEKREVYEEEEKTKSEAPVDKVSQLLPTTDAVEVVEQEETNQENAENLRENPFKNPFADGLDFEEDGDKSEHQDEENGGEKEGEVEQVGDGWENEQREQEEEQLDEGRADKAGSWEEVKNIEESDENEKKQLEQEPKDNKDNLGEFGVEETEKAEESEEKPEEKDAEDAKKLVEKEDASKEQQDLQADQESNDGMKSDEKEENKKEVQEHEGKDEETNREEEKGEEVADLQIDQGEWGVDENANKRERNEGKKEHHEDVKPQDENKEENAHKTDKKDEPTSTEQEDEIQIDQGELGVDEHDSKEQGKPLEQPEEDKEAVKSKQSEDLQIDEGGWGADEDTTKTEDIERDQKAKDQGKDLKIEEGGWGFDVDHPPKNEKNEGKPKKSESKVSKGGWGFDFEESPKKAAEEREKHLQVVQEGWGLDESASKPPKNKDNTTKSLDITAKVSDPLEFADDWGAGAWGSKEQTPKNTKSSKPESISPNSKSITEDTKKGITFAVNKSGSSEKKLEKSINEDDPFGLMNTKPQTTAQPEKKGFVINKNLITQPKAIQNKPLLLPVGQKPANKTNDFNLEDLLGNNFKK